MRRKKSSAWLALTVGGSLLVGSLRAAEPPTIEGWQPAAPLPAITSGAPGAVAPAPLASNSPATSQEPLATPLTLSQLEELSLNGHPALNEAAYAVRAAEARAYQAGLYPNPTVGYRGEEIGEGGKAGQQGGFVRQEFVTAGKLGLRRAVVCQEVERARWAWNTQRLRVIGDVRRRYYDLLAAQQAVDLNRRLAAIGGEAVKAAASLYRAQEVSRVDELQARVEFDTAQLRLREAENRHQAAWRQLVSTLGLEQLPANAVAGDLEQLPSEIAWESALARLLDESPQLAEARFTVQRAQRRLDLECAQRVPNLEIDADVRHNNDSGYTTSSVEVGVPLPLFNRNQGNIASARAEIGAAQWAVERLQLALQQQLAEVFERYTSSRQGVQQYREAILPNAKQSLDLLQAAYRQGEIGYPTLLIAQRTHFQAQLAYLENLRQLHLSANEIECLLLQESLTSNGAASASEP